MRLTELTNPRRLLAGAALCAVGAMAAGYYTQYFEGLEPCPLCIVQRLAYVSAGGLALVAALVGADRGARAWLLRLLALLASVSALGGAAVAGWHVWLMAYPPQWLSCGRPFAWMLENNSLVNLIPKLFKGEGDCLAVKWTLLGLTIPQWSLGLFVIFLVLCLSALKRSFRIQK